jgi:hypothetical protein
MSVADDDDAQPQTPMGAALSDNDEDEGALEPLRPLGDVDELMDGEEEEEELEVGKGSALLSHMVATALYPPGSLRISEIQNLRRTGLPAPGGRPVALFRTRYVLNWMLR